jgi:hypothetical protein
MTASTHRCTQRQVSRVAFHDFYCADITCGTLRASHTALVDGKATQSHGDSADRLVTSQR